MNVVPTAPQARASIRFPGLDSLRFVAAMFVVIGHVPLNQASVRLPHPAWGAFFYRGAPAVYFFFTLSGFLITYLLLEESQRTGTVDVRSFYLRRVLRIWPLYFAVVAGGLALYNFLLPALGFERPVGYRIWVAVALYSAFLPNLMNSLHAMGGVLNPLWSIGIEEQFYLGWAPIAKRFRRQLPRIAGAILLISFLSSCAASAGIYGHGSAQMFAGQLKFHFMAIGALWAWACKHHRERVLAFVMFRSSLVRVLFWGLLAEHYTVGLIARGDIASELLQMVLYGWLVVEVGVNPRKLLHIATPISEYLGRISYGIYMLHMPAVYATSFLFLRTRWWIGHLGEYLISYYTIAISLTLLLAAASHAFYEAPFLRLKDRISVLGSGGTVAPFRSIDPAGAVPLASATSEAP